MQGGSASGARAVSARFNARPARPVQLRLGASRRRRDGAIGGSVLGRRARGGGPRAGKVRTPRFRGTKPGVPRAGKVRTPRFRGTKPGVPRSGKVRTPRFRGTKPGALGGRRAPGSSLNGRRAFGRRRSLWRIFGKRSGGIR